MTDCQVVFHAVVLTIEISVLKFPTKSATSSHVLKCQTHKLGRTHTHKKKKKKKVKKKKVLTPT